MKRTFIKKNEDVIEKFELIDEEKWVYVHYSRGKHEKKAMFLKKRGKPLKYHLQDFFIENGVTYEMTRDVNRVILHEKVDFEDLVKASSLHMGIGIMFAIACITGFKLGAKLDLMFGRYPLFTLIGLFLGISLGGFTAFKMMKKYLIPHMTSSENPQEKRGMSMFKRFRKKKQKQEFPLIDVTLQEVRKAVVTFSDNLAKGVFTSILVKDDNSIDFEQLTHILKGLPTKKYYMSKETFDIFEEEEKEIPVIIDIVQRAVDAYVKENKQLPIIKYDPSFRVNYYLLMQEGFLDFRPEIQMYFSEKDKMITHVKPKD